MTSDETTAAPLDRAAIKRRRIWLYAFAGLALIAVIGFAALQLLDGDDKKTDQQNVRKPPVILERFQLKPVGGQSGRGLAEFVRRESNDGLRVLAVQLRPVLDGEVYQLLLAGGQPKPKLLGNEIVGANKTFIGEAKIDAATLHKYKRIELRRTGQGNPPPTKLVLRGKIPN